MKITRYSNSLVFEAQDDEDLEIIDVLRNYTEDFIDDSWTWYDEEHNIFILGHPDFWGQSPIRERFVQKTWED